MVVSACSSQQLRGCLAAVAFVIFPSKRHLCPHCICTAVAFFLVGSRRRCGLPIVSCSAQPCCISSPQALRVTMVVVRLPALHCVVAVAACLALLGGGVAGKSVQQGTISPLYHNSVHARAPAGAWLDSSSPVYSQPVQSLVALLQRNASIRVAIETSIHDAYVAIPSQERDRFYGKFGLPRVRNLGECRFSSW